MPNAIILHGGPSRDEYYDPKLPCESNKHWLPWLQAQLLKADIDAATPEVPRSYDRDWETWKREFERFDILPDTILVGHSTGAGFIIKYLSIHLEVRVGKVVLVAPWLDPARELPTNFFSDFELDPEVAGRTAAMTIFESDNDMASIHQTVTQLREKIPGVQHRRFHSYGHFCFEDMGTAEFPELLEELVR